MKKKRKLKVPVIVIGCILVLGIIAVFIIFPPGSGKLPEYKTENGLSERARVKTDTGDLEIILLSENTDNPVLLVCGGGPGIPQYLLEYCYPSALSEVFTVCYWDYRGTGASYRSDDAKTMTTDRYIKDALAVTDYLSERFSDDRIFIMGHSFGTYLALKTVQAYPERYRCYIAMSQIVDQKQSEYLAFDYMKGCYEKSGIGMAKRFQKYDIRGSEEDYNDYFFSGLRDKAMHDLGVGTTRDMRSVISGIFFPSLRCRAYSQAERIKIWKGKALSRSFPVTQDAITFNARRDVPEIEIPVCFIVGKYDYTCCASLQEEYYEEIEAPEKELFLFEDSAHSPLYEEYEKGKQVLTEIRDRYGKAN
ncbi:MAG: alpha/beta hydrolase [Lachnospiraceae bacterium]|nr:alpha/beta hydrolase [Lachnospiraceae bacterium]